MLDPRELQELIAFGGDFAAIAAKEALDNFEAGSDIFFQLLLTKPELVVSGAMDRMLFLKRELWDTPGDIPAGVAERYDDMRLKHDLFFSRLSAYAEAHPAQADALIKAVGDYFPGARRELTARYGVTFDPAEPPYLRQLMIFVTGACNLHCPYCFSENIAHRTVSLSELHRIFDWAKRNGVTRMTPCGGEPLMYPYLDEFLRLCEEYGMSTYFATNFTIDVEPMERLRAPLVHNLFIHLSDQTFAHKRLVDRLVANIDVCRDRGIELIGRANFTEPSFEPVKRWFDFLESHDIKRLNVALTIPSAESTNTYIDLQTFSEYIPTLVEAIEYSRSHGFELSFAKPVPPCLFPEKYHDELLNPKWGALFCNISEDDCMRNLNLSPDMQFTPCLGLPTPGREFSDDVTWDELAELFRPTVMRLSASPSMERCRDCYLWRKRLCQGACLSYKR